jgi:hypothetical protein
LQRSVDGGSTYCIVDCDYVTTICARYSRQKNNQHTATTFILYWPFLMKIISIINIHMVAMANFKPMCVCLVRDGLIIMDPYLYCFHASIFLLVKDLILNK